VVTDTPVRLMALVLAVGIGLAACSTGSAPGDTTEARVARVVDGDTLVLEDERRVRLIGIDTPETVDPRRPVECFGREASARLAELLPPGSTVELEMDVEATDRYGRTLAYVRRAGDDDTVNVILAREGYAEQLTVPPNVRYADALGAAVRDAREAGRGLWAEGACASSP
jgi:micrococcal nuclease